MTHSPHADIPPDDVEHPSDAFQTQCYRNAIDQLRIALAEKRPLAIMTAEGRTAPAFVIRKFLADLDDQTTVIHMSEACANRSDFMQRVIQSIGFEPKNLSLSDLDSILNMFLSFQRGHGRRTILCIEEAQDCNWWVLDKVCSLVNQELKKRAGLLILLVGQPSLKTLLVRRPLEAVVKRAGEPISLRPFKLNETREYIRRRVETSGTATVDRAFEYDAIPLLHELCAGVPDAIATLVSRCREQADEQGRGVVNKDIVKLAYESLRSSAAATTSDPATETVNMVSGASRTARLLIQLTGKEVEELALGRGHVLIGRSKLCDIQITKPAVSRQHALIAYSKDGATLIDLASRNGTYVDGHRVNEHSLVPGETIEIGECRIEYIMDENQPLQYENLARADTDTAKSTAQPSLAKNEN